VTIWISEQVTEGWSTSHNDELHITEKIKSEFDSWWGLGIFLFTTVSRTVLGTTQPRIQWVSGALSLG
jgi:hypothetical protein